jgi:hypothetical protein
MVRFGADSDRSEGILISDKCLLLCADGEGETKQS